METHKLKLVVFLYISLIIHFTGTNNVRCEGYPMSTNMAGFRWFPKYFGILVVWTKVALAFEGLIM